MIAATLEWGAKHVVFESDNSNDPAKFYVVSTLAHKTYPNKKLPFKNAVAMSMGKQEDMNKRTIISTLMH